MRLISNLKVDGRQLIESSIILYQNLPTPCILWCSGDILITVDLKGKSITMNTKRKYNKIPVALSESEFNEFVLKHLKKGKSGPPKKIFSVATTTFNWGAAPEKNFLPQVSHVFELIHFKC